MSERASLTTRAALASVATATFLLCLKAYAAWATGSVAMLGSLADTGLDLIASLITLFAVRVAAMPADRDHRFGHGKAESIAALVQVGIIFISATGIGWRAIGRLTDGARPGEAAEGIAISLVAIMVTLLLVAYQKRIVRATGSVAIRADFVHYQSDLLLNLAVIAALALEQYAGLAGADPLFGIAIALWLAWGAWRASTHAVDQLMDKEWPAEKRQRLVDIAGAHPALKGLHDLKTRTSGVQDFAQFHIWLDPLMTVMAAHDAVEQVENELAAAFPDCEILIHIDPEGQVDQPGDPIAETDLTREGIEE
jgi:ferrous-iron efflux pump FieF